MNATPTQVRRTDPAKRVLPPRPFVAVLFAASFTMLLYVIEVVDRILPTNLQQEGIQARTLSGLDGVLWAPMLHGPWGHVVANTVPVALFGFLVMSGGIGQWIAVTATVWLFSGLGVWLVGPSDAVTIGASGLAFGWLAFLLVRGIFNRSVGQLVLAAVLFFVYGGMFWGVLPTVAGNVSWQGHLFGAVAGVLAAWLVARADRPTRPPARPAGATLPGNLGA
ncbi:rhomboid family intramembrane serine protease [Haloechinothrix halophila]|uniref:rhomboid family intramembrane serine protease n=1 Tax=Haloechinothrix halophila TaxID=1069073 RepID=UPI000685F0D2|nr:rhomboid family intramembrane serine protease [Haloechinothrix halophila]